MTVANDNVVSIDVPDDDAEMKEQAAEALFEYLKHGDDRHQAWLKKALYAFFRGELRPEVV